MEVELTAASVQRDVATIEAFKSKMLEEEEKQQVGFIRMFTYGDEVYAQELPPVLVNNIVSVMEDVANEMKLTLQQTAKLLNSVYSYLP
jgi:regulator of sirC expression with transglutaminase-like and TPR domain